MRRYWFNINYKPTVKDEWTRDDGTKLLMCGDMYASTERKAFTFLIRSFVNRRLKGVTIRLYED